MDENFARLHRIYPDSRYVLIPKYDENLWKDRQYNSAFDTKATITRWKTNALTYEDALVAIESGYRIGWIVPKGYVVVDVDNQDDSRSQEYLERLLNKFEVQYSYNYTSKGIHILFTDPLNKIKTDSRTKCSLNIEIDTRANESGYIVLPVNDPHRKWGKWRDVVEDIPYFLKPLLKDKTTSFIGMTDGDGRNDALFKWRTKLEQSHKLSEEEVEKSIRIINENLFDTPMTNQELYKTVLRDKSEKKAKESPLDRQNIYNELADELISRKDIIANGGDFYAFNGVYYKRIHTVDIERMIHFDISTNLSQTARNEIINFIKVKTQVPVEDFDKQWYKIACKNGILNLVTGELTQPSKTEINTIYIPFNYVADPPHSDKIDNFMVEICNGDPYKMEFLYQIAGYCLLKKNLFEKFFIFKGEGGTGKSTFQNLIYKLVGGDMNCSHVSLDNFDRDYYLSNIVGKLVNLDDDVVNNKILSNTGRFKSIVSGNTISVRRIYSDVVSFTPFATCIFNCNKLPKIMDKTSGLYRRMILVELNHKVEKPDPLFMTKITDTDMEYFLFKAVEAINTAIEEGHFRITKSEKELIDEFKRSQSPLDEWIYENQFALEDIHNRRCSVLYSSFVSWCESSGYTKPMHITAFKDDICTLFNVSVEFEKTDTRVRPQIFYKHGRVDLSYRPY